MNNITIKDIRRYLLKELESYEGEPIKLNLDSNTLKEILFDYDKETNSYKLIERFHSSQKENIDTRKLLQKIDFSNVSFDNVNIRGIDFTNFKGVKINPQTIYEKSIWMSKLCGVEFIGPFDNVQIINTDFTGSVGAVIDPQTIYGKYISGTKFSGVTFTGPFDDVYIQNVDFKGSTGAVINPTTVRERNLANSCFSGVTFEGPFDGAKISHADFTGSIGAKIDPRNLYKRIIRANLCDVTLVGEGDIYEDAHIYNTSFKGAKGNLEINPQTVKNNDLRYSNFEGVTFNGIFNNCAISGSSFVNARGVKIDAQEIPGKDISNTKLKGVHIEGTLYDTLIVGTDFTGSTGAVINPQLVRGKNISGAVLTDTIVVDDFYEVDTYDTVFDGASFIEPDKKKVISEEEKQKRKCISMIKSSFNK